MDDHGLMLSVVATSRNDDHGANLLRRMQTFVSAFIAQCRRHDFPAELILVEWNPPADRPRLAQALHWPADPSPCRVRIIEVPPALHRRFQHADALPLFQMIAKNVGIRRARGRFILATNIDILFDDELIRFLKEGGLEKGKIYRIDRTDVETDVPVSAPVEQQLAYCRTHHVRLNTSVGTFPLSPEGHLVMAAEDVAAPDSGIVLGGDISAVDRDAAGEMFRWAGSNVRLLVKTPPDRPRRLLLEVSPGPCVRRLPAGLEILVADKVVARGHILGRCLVALSLPVRPGAPAEFGLRASEGGYFPPPPPDSRILDFAIHHLWWSQDTPAASPASPEGAFQALAAAPALADLAAAAAGDVVNPAAGLGLDQGWHPLRGWKGLRFRWADSGAGLIVRRDGRAAAALRLWAGAGPGRAGRNTTLQLRGDGDRVLAEAALRRGPHPITLPLPAGYAGGRLSLHVAQDGPADGQGVRAFRLFSAAWSDAPAPERLSAALRALLTGLALGGRDAARALKRLRHRRWLRRMRRRGRRDWLAGPASLPRLHTNACGDFTLMARKHWEQLRGYSEFEIFSMHLDSLLLYAAHIAGLEQVVLEPPMRAYHIEHSAGSGWTPEGEKQLFARIEKKGIPAMSLDELADLVGEMRERDDPALFNGAGWGLADEDLPETRPGRAGLPRAA